MLLVSFIFFSLYFYLYINFNFLIMNSLYSATAKGPINIALIKYWGKDNEELITPLNNSISLTLDTNNLYTLTKLEIVPINESKNKITLTINSKPSEITSRLISIIESFKQIANDKLNSKQAYHFIITSSNTFPTASGCASSASSMAALVTCFDKALDTKLSKDKLSALARMGSGSACRSVIGGIAEWIKEGGNDSHAVQLYDEKYWKLNVMLIIVNNEKKEISSSKGMKMTKETSSFINFRVDNVVPLHINKIKEGFKNKDFNIVGEIIMKDSNNFHAVCRDTFPPICYMNSQSEYIIKCVNAINTKENKIICAYTFDAGSNGFVIFEENNKEKIVSFFKEALHSNNSNDEIINNLIKVRPDVSLFKNEVIFNLGSGPEVVS